MCPLNRISSLKLEPSVRRRGRTIDWQDLYFPIGCGMVKDGVPANIPLIRHSDGSYTPVNWIFHFFKFSCFCVLFFGENAYFRIMGLLLRCKSKNTTQMLYMVGAQQIVNLCRMATTIIIINTLIVHRILINIIQVNTLLFDVFFDLNYLTRDRAMKMNFFFN